LKTKANQNQKENIGFPCYQFMVLVMPEVLYLDD
jgi:hypothetical protein